MKPGLLSGMSFSSGISKALSFLASVLDTSAVPECILLSVCVGRGGGHSQFASQLPTGESLGVLTIKILQGLFLRE